MTSSLAAALEKVAALHFPQLTFGAARDVIKELLATTTEAAIDKAISSLNDTAKGTLMKVIYVALGSDSKNSTVYLKWHGQLYVAAGPGCVMRVLTDKPPPQSVMGDA